eukprot:15447066-Alexandrium_andersonii.AAC.1
MACATDSLMAQGAPTFESSPLGEGHCEPQGRTPPQRQTLARARAKDGPRLRLAHVSGTSHL